MPFMTGFKLTGSASLVGKWTVKVATSGLKPAGSNEGHEGVTINLTVIWNPMGSVCASGVCVFSPLGRSHGNDDDCPLSGMPVGAPAAEKRPMSPRHKP